ncbi:MAG: prolipoprotein diacylglyceryl transferase, partial [Bacteroidota bacterium]
MNLLNNVLYIIWDIDPRIISEFEFLRWYGIFWVIGLLLSYQVMLKICIEEKQLQFGLDQLITYLILGIILGARFGHILFYDPVYYWQHPIEILPISLEPTLRFTGLSGLASHGGVLGAFIAFYLYNKKYPTNYFWLLDRLTIAASLLGGCIRLGNLMNSEIIGIPTSLPWAFIFLRIDELPRHPTQLYEAIFYLLIFTLLFILWKSGKIRQNKGFLFGLGFLLIFTQRFLVEFVKENQVAFEKGLLLNMGQILSIPMICIGILMIIWSR